MIPVTVRRVIYSFALVVAFALAVGALPDEVARAQSGPKRPPITGVASFAAKVSTLEDARAFYSGVLGLQEAFTIKNPVGGSDLTTFKINDQQYVYIAPDLKDPNESRLLFVGFETKDAKALRTYLASKGVEVPQSVSADAAGNLSLFVKDPEGNVVQFIQYQSKGLHARNKGKFVSARRLSDHALHVGYRIRDPEALDRFYKDIL
ncbi:MAG TPA: VOC family protein, partial [Vicinamibacterales bacterium]|nr:VOC family protein [Vicinamibacterales bacterium]